MSLRRRKTTVIGAIAAVSVLLVVGYWLFKDDVAAFAAYAVNEQTHPALFIGLFVLLPLIGFPITAFLVLLGAKFGVWVGLGLMAVCMPIHLLASFLVVHSFLRRLVFRVLTHIDYRPPQVPPEREAWFSFVFMAVPGLSYTLKNYILPLAGVSVRNFFLSGFLVQGAMGVPFVIAGQAAAGESLLLLGAVLLVLVAVYGVVYRLRKHHAGIFRAG